MPDQDPGTEEDAPRDVPATFEGPGPTPVNADPGYTADGIPTFESVREKIETRYGTSQGAVELGEESAQAREAEQQYEARQKAATERVEQIRASMHPKSDT
jgi:phage shock protein A